MAISLKGLLDPGTPLVFMKRAMFVITLCSCAPRQPAGDQYGDGHADDDDGGNNGDDGDGGSHDDDHIHER